MRNLITALFIVTGFVAFGQTNNAKPNRGIEMQVNTSLAFISADQKMSVGLTDADGDSFIYGYERDYQEVGASADFQLGYRFNNKWSAGGYAGAVLYYEGFSFFLPNIGGSVDAGAYGTRHFNDKFSLTASVGSRIPPIGRFAGTFGVSPEVALGKTKQIKLRYSAEIFYGKRNAHYYHSRYDYDYNNPPEVWTGNEVEVFEGYAPETTFGFQHEVGLAFTFRK